MTLLESLDKSIKKAIGDGSLDPVKHGATIEAARKMAAVMDGETWPIVNGKFDNVFPGTFLKYCTALNLVPAEAKQTKKKEPDKPAELKMVGNSRWKRQA